MIDKRFSSQEFVSKGLDSVESAELSAILAQEIQQELYEGIRIKLDEIVQQLNNMGHNLKSEYPPTPGDISFRDEWTDSSGYHCKLRICFDSVISTGYSHLLNSDEEIEAYIENL